MIRKLVRAVKDGMRLISIFSMHRIVRLISAMVSYDALFYEPFYQLMRQQLLANEMEKEHEDGAKIVSVLHIAPAHNLDFKRVTSPELVGLGDSPTSVWKKLIRKQDRFASVSTEALFGDLPTEKYPEIKAWAEYIHKRYNWVTSL